MASGGSHRHRSRSRERRGDREREGARSDHHWRSRHGDRSRSRSPHRDRHDRDRSERRRERGDRDRRSSHRKVEHEERRSKGTEAFAGEADGTNEAAVAAIPTSDTSNEWQARLPANPSTSTQIGRDQWMLPNHSEGRGNEAEDDFFGSLAGEGRKRKPAPEKRNPDELHVSSREINQQFKQGKHIDDYDDVKPASSAAHGGAGSQWRMMKLRRVYEAAEEEGRDVEEVALQRYGSLESFNEARAERQYLDDQRGGRSDAGTSAASSRMSSRQSSFRRPGTSAEENSAAPSPKNIVQQRSERFRQSGYGSDPSKPSTPVPNVFTPPALPIETSVDKASSSMLLKRSQLSTEVSGPVLDAASLNKLSARVLRAELMGSGDAEELREQLEREKVRAQSGGDLGFADQQIAGHAIGRGEGRQVQVLPTLDARGRLYDVGSGSNDEAAVPAGNRRKKAERKFESRDGKTGEMLRFNADDDDHTLADLVREERFGAGSAAHKNMDAQMADRIASDRSYRNDVDYVDENVERLGRRKMKSDAMKRMFAVQDYAKTKKALDTCVYCSQDDSRPPQANVVSSGTRCFLALPDKEALVEGHCLLVPMQHHLSMLEADEDTFEEMKNFMKCLIQMAAAQGKGVVFFETVSSLRNQRHTFVEAVPIEQSLFSQLPIYFRQAILDVGDEWSQNKRLIEFSAERPFKRSMVADLPYFMVQWDHRGQRGYGHVIEAGEGAGDEGDGWGLEDQAKGRTGQFPHWFAGQVLGNLLEYEPRRWRKPRRLDGGERQSVRQRFVERWSKYDWTRMLDGST